MKTYKSLPPGRVHELRMGVTTNRKGKPENIPYLDFLSSMRQVIKSELVIIDEVGRVEIKYNPGNPTWDESPILFRSVKRHLPKRPKMSLYLYNAVGSSLDIYHGVDIFFLWKGVFVTIDLSLHEKQLRSTVDLVVNLEGMDDEAFDVLGKQIADLLKKRRFNNKLSSFILNPD